MSTMCDAIIVGAGPAGSTAAIRLAQAGWSVALVEKHAFPRRKVCGECIAATNLPLLDALGVGHAFDDLAGPELRHVGLFVNAHELIAPLPPDRASSYPWGRALGREHLDHLLVQRAAAVGATIWQPWTVKSMTHQDGQHVCELSSAQSDARETLTAPILIAAHGSWERDPAGESVAPAPRDADLFGFKGTFVGADIAPGLLPVLAFAGGYGGMVLGDHERTTLAFCIRRDALRESRARHRGLKAAQAAAEHVQAQCAGARRVLATATLEGPWLSIGPIRPGIRSPWHGGGVFAIGNAAGEAHPILGEGISMAIQSAWLLSERLLSREQDLRGERSKHADALREVGKDYAARWQRSFAPRIRLSSAFGQLAMRPGLSRPLLPLIRRWPGLLTTGARLGAKVRHVV